MSLPGRCSDLWNDIVDVPVAVAVVVGILTSGLVASEAMLYGGNTTAAAWGYFLLLIICTLAPIYVRNLLPVFFGFVLLPVFRLVNLSLPVFAELTVYWLLLVYLPFLPVGMTAARHINVLESDRRWNRIVLLVPVALVGGSALGALSFRVEVPTLLVPTVTFPALTVLAGVVVTAAVVEELLFRVLLQTTLQRHIGTWPGIVLAAGVFAATRLPGGGGAAAVAFLAGLLYGMAYKLSDSWIVPSLFHSVSNVMLYAVLPAYGTKIGFL